MTRFWLVLWKAVFILGIGLFFVMAVWVIIAGRRDVKRLISGLRQNRD